MNEIVNYYKEREDNTAELARDALELQHGIDEDETIFDPTKVTWANLRTDEETCKTICGFTVDEFLILFDLVEDSMAETVGRGRRSKIPLKSKEYKLHC